MKLSENIDRLYYDFKTRSARVYLKDEQGHDSDAIPGLLFRVDPGALRITVYVANVRHTKFMRVEGEGYRWILMKVGYGKTTRVEAAEEDTEIA